MATRLVPHDNNDAVEYLALLSEVKHNAGRLVGLYQARAKRIQEALETLHPDNPDKDISAITASLVAALETNDPMIATVSMMLARKLNDMRALYDRPRQQQDAQ